MLKRYFQNQSLCRPGAYVRTLKVKSPPVSRTPRISKSRSASRTSRPPEVMSKLDISCCVFIPACTQGWTAPLTRECYNMLCELTPIPAAKSAKIEGIGIFLIRLYRYSPTFPAINPYIGRIKTPPYLKRSNEKMAPVTSYITIFVCDFYFLADFWPTSFSYFAVFHTNLCHQIAAGLQVRRA